MVPKRIRLAQRYAAPHNGLFIMALFLFIAFLLFEITTRIYDLYRVLPEVDIPSHFLAGLALGAGSYWFLSMTLVSRKKVSAVAFTFVGAIIWEILETLEELVIENPNHLKDIFFWDGFWDIIVTVIGGTAIVLFINFARGRLSFLRALE